MFREMLSAKRAKYISLSCISIIIKFRLITIHEICTEFTAMKFFASLIKWVLKEKTYRSRKSAQHFLHPHPRMWLH